MPQNENTQVRPSDAPLTPNELTLLTHYYLREDNPELLHAIFASALRGLTMKSMLVDKADGGYELTERARIYMRRVLATPLPTLHWSYQDA